nr:immunoglobulin heavy chain junction region [Mus musculus]
CARWGLPFWYFDVW